MISILPTRPRAVPARALRPRWSRPATAGLVVPRAPAISASGRPSRWCISTARRCPSGSPARAPASREQFLVADRPVTGRRLVGRRLEAGPLGTVERPLPRPSPLAGARGGGPRRPGCGAGSLGARRRSGPRSASRGAARWASSRVSWTTPERSMRARARAPPPAGQPGSGNRGTAPARRPDRLPPSRPPALDLADAGRAPTRPV